MTITSDDTLQTLQHQTQRLLGRCLLLLQQYERQIKAIVAHQEISGPFHDLEEIQAARIAKTARNTLGTLVADLLESYIGTDEIDEHVDASPESSDNGGSFGMRIGLTLSDADFAKTENELKELVLLRNNLVHRFYRPT